MRQAGRIVSEVLDRIGRVIAPGVTTAELDEVAGELCTRRGAVCLFKGVPNPRQAGPFPGNICASVNDELVHGIPSHQRVIRDGDIVTVDFGVKLDGWCADAARTFLVGQVPESQQRLVRVTESTLAIARRMMKPGQRWSRIARAMQQNVEDEGFSVVRDFVGHGIGRDMHEDPKVPNFVSRQLEMRDIILEEGMVLAVEPMVNMGSAGTRYGSDGWTVLTRDGLPSAHVEDTIAVTANGVSVLTNGSE